MAGDRFLRLARIASHMKQSSFVDIPVYHGTDVTFDQFQHMEGTRSTTLGNEWKVSSGGFFFSDNIEDALEYGDHVVECRITVQNPLATFERGYSPLTYSGKGWPSDKREDAAYIFDSLLRQGDDGRYWVSVGLGAKSVMRDDDGEVDPHWVDYLSDVPWMALEAPGVAERMHERGYDGTLVSEPDSQSGYSYFVMDPSQIEIVRWIR